METKSLIGAGVASIGALAASLLIENVNQHASWRKRGFYGPGEKTHKRLTDGTPSSTRLRVTRQQERAEGRAELKAMIGRQKRVARKDGAALRASRVSERDLAAGGRRSLHDFMEALDGAGRR